MDTHNETREQIVNRILNRGIVTTILPDQKVFAEKLASTTPLRIYIGADPTSTALHLSHAKNYMLLEEFRQLGHEVIVLFGDFTAKIGDPSDRMTARAQLTTEDVEQNVASWVRQIKPLMNFEDSVNPPQIKFNGDWLSNLSMEDVVRLTSHFTVQQMMERDMFAKRMETNKPIYLHEFLYPLMQGYDSVAMDVDVELCGTDQTFNALVGRTLQSVINKKNKFVVTVNLMEDPKTGELMSKSRGTGVFLDADPFNMFGSIMSLSDEMTRVILINNTRLPLKEIETILQTANPRDAKMRAAFEVTRIFHGEEGAVHGQERFVALVQNKEISGDIPEKEISETSLSLFNLVRNCLDETEASNTEIRRLISQNSIKINNVQNNDLEAIIEIPAEGLVMQVGKKRWFKVAPKK